MKSIGLILTFCIFSICGSFSQNTLSPNNSSSADIFNEPTNRYSEVCSLLAGTWRVTDLDFLDYLESLPEDERATFFAHKDMFEAYIKTTVYTFNKDGSFSTSQILFGVEDFSEGTWTLSDDGFTLTTSTVHRKTDMFIVQISDSVLMMNVIVDGHTVSFSCAKSSYQMADDDSEIRKKFVGLWKASEVSISLVSENATEEERQDFESFPPFLVESFKSMEMTLNEDGNMTISYSFIGEDRFVEGSWNVTINGDTFFSKMSTGPDDVWFVEEISENRLILRFSSSHHNVFMVYLKVEN
jgi:hypothetical protein